MIRMMWVSLVVAGLAMCGPAADAAPLLITDNDGGQAYDVSAYALGAGDSLEYGGTAAALTFDTILFSAANDFSLTLDGLSAVLNGASGTFNVSFIATLTRLGDLPQVLTYTTTTAASSTLPESLGNFAAGDYVLTLSGFARRGFTFRSIDYDVSIDVAAAPVPAPEPGTLALLATGGLGLSGGWYRRKRAAA